MATKAVDEILSTMDGLLMGLWHILFHMMFERQLLSAV